MTKEHAAASLISGMTRMLTGASAQWHNCEPSVRQRVYFANHTSHLDFVVLWSALPPAVRTLVRPVAAEDYWQSTPLRQYLAEKVFNAVLIPRPGRRSGESREAVLAATEQAISAMTNAMGSRHSLILFPEGTRGSGLTIAPFKSGLYALAQRKPDVELVPVYMENLSRILPKGDYLPVPLLGSVSIGAPIRLGENEKKAEFLSRARNMVEALRNI